MANQVGNGPLSSEEAEILSTDAPTALDPRLQRLVARRLYGAIERPGTSTGRDEVAVIAKVTDRDAWEGLSDVRMGGVVGGADQDGTLIVTARIPVTRIEYLRQQPFVRSLKATQPLQPTLNRTIAETGARAALLPAGNQSDGAAGVVVGIVDFGFDFVHRNFRNPDGSTRAISIWRQAGPANPASPFGYGREFSRDQINAALQQPDPYAALGYEPFPDSALPSPGTHGTHVGDIAAGNGRGSGTPGVAPSAEIIFVDVSASDLPREGPEVVGSSFGDSTRLLEALLYIFDRAGDRPCVVNVSLGTNGGPHDGSTLVEDGLDRLIRGGPNRAVVIAAANSFADGIHAVGNVSAGAPADLIWQVRPGDTTHNELELWYSGEDQFAVELIAPGGNSLGRVEPGQNGAVRLGGEVVIFAANRLADPNNGDNQIGVFLESGLPSGSWTVRLHGVSVQDGGFHAWIERDDRNPSNFAPPHDNSMTLGSISCGQETTVVGSYDAHAASLLLSFFSSSGPTRDGRQKPEVSAPGHAVFAAHSRTLTGTVQKSGTSMAAPSVSGVIALMMAQAQAQGTPLASADIRRILRQTARRNPPSGTDWHPRHGNGRVSAAGAVEAVMGLAPPRPVASRGRVRRKAAKRKAAGR